MTFQEVLNVEKENVVISYHLQGLIVHSGNGHAGHYYSFITNFQHNNWRQFNDKIISPPVSIFSVKKKLVANMYFITDSFHCYCTTCEKKI